MSFYQHEFEANIARHSLGFNKKGELFYTVLFVPAEVCSALPLKQYPRLRIEGEMAAMPFAGAMQPAKGRWYLLISHRFMRENDLALGDQVEVRFNIADQDHVDLPDELADALAANAAAMDIWDKSTPGKKRSYAAQVAGAKQAATRVRRANKVVAAILEDNKAGGRTS